MGEKCKHKSLLMRIRSLTFITTAVSVIIMTIVMLVIFGQGFQLVEKILAEYYVDKIEETVLRSSIEKDGDIVIDNYRRVVGEIEKLHDTVPYLTIKVMIDNKFVYRKFGDLYLTEILKIELDEDEKKLSKKVENEIPQNYVVSELYTSDEKYYGYISVGVDNKLIGILKLILVLIVIPIALLVMLVMGLFAKLLTKPLLNPISELTNQLNQLADEKYDTIAPSLVIDRNNVKEVYELSLATNRLLDKMLDYNEVITQSEKMASIGQLTAAITHEINTPLGAINANVNMIKLLSKSLPEDMYKSDEGINEIRQQIVDASTLSEEACARIDKIVRSLKLYTRIDQTDFMPADINESVKSVIVLTTNLHKNRITIHTKYGDVAKVSCHIGLMNQVFMNIFINSIQAIENKGEITIKTYSDEENVYVSISDTGCGISHKNIYNIFQYGFTTKQPGSGSGIGLALSNNIIKKHNGSITVDSKEGEGATFTVTIPIKQNNKEK